MNNEEQFLGFYKTWPRPRITCEECKQELVLKWGEKNIPHFSHISNTKNKCKNNKESIYHKLSKELLFNLLKNNCLLKIKIKCKNCTDTVIKQLHLKKNQKIQLEYKYDNSIADIAILEDDKIIYIIEIYHTNLTRNRNYNWYEFEARDIIQLVGNNKLDKIKEIELDCIRERQKCNKKYCLSMYDIAEELQYGQYMFINDSYHEIKKAMNKCHIPYFQYFDSPIWYIEEEDKPKNNNLYWKIFLKRHKCLACCKNQDTSFGKPYCINCYKNIKKEKDCKFGIPNEKNLLNIEYYDNDNLLPDFEVERLRKKYSFLKNINNLINNYKDKEILCDICNNNILTNSSEELIWWFGNYKCICFKCIEKDNLNKTINKNKNITFILSDDEE